MPRNEHYDANCRDQSCLECHGEVPRTARTIRKLAEANGWVTVSTWAYQVTRPGRPPTIVDSYALRMTTGQRYMWAVWLDGRYDAGQIWRPDGIPVSVSLTEIRREIIA